MSEAMVTADLISRSYGEVRALDSISFRVKPGELMGFLGPDGAGKTSLFRILTTLLLPTTGSATISGYDVIKDYRKIRKITGYMPGRFSLYQDLSVSQNLKFYARIFGVDIRDNYYLIRDIYAQLEPFRDRLAGKLSGGMKQKLALCCALIHKPRVLVLDEPTTGVDAISRKEFWTMLKRLQQEDITILVSTPYMDEAGMCDRVALFQQGKLLANDKPENIPLMFKGKLYSAMAEDNYRLLHELRLRPEIERAYLYGQQIHFSLKEEQNSPELIQRHLAGQGFAGIFVHEITPSVEDCFIALMGKEEAI